MALTIQTLKNAAAAYVDATKQLQSKFVPTVDDFTKTVCKIGEMTTLYLPHVDKLPELSGDNLPFGETIEEFMVNDFLPSDFLTEGCGRNRFRVRLKRLCRGHYYRNHFILHVRQRILYQL